MIADRGHSRIATFIFTPYLIKSTIPYWRDMVANKRLQFYLFLWYHLVVWNARSLYKYINSTIELTKDRLILNFETRVDIINAISDITTSSIGCLPNRTIHTDSRLERLTNVSRRKLSAIFHEQLDRSGHSRHRRPPWWSQNTRKLFFYRKYMVFDIQIFLSQ